MTSNARAPWIVVALILGFVACAPDEPPPRFYREDFEELCEGAPCGWARSTGDDDQAILIETIHPGEHGLRLTGEVSVRGPAAEAEEPIVSASMFVRATARCDAGSALRIDVVLADTLGGELTASAIVIPPAEWSAPFDVTPTLTGAAVPGTVSGVVAIGIAKSGPGACEISEIAIDDQILPSGC